MSDIKISEATVVGYRWRHSAGEKWQYSDTPCGWEHEPLYLHPQPAELAFDVETMLAACVPGGSVVDPQVVADNIRAWLTHHKTAASTEKQTREIRIPARNNLDPISVFVQDQAWGRGRIVVTCYGNAWQGFWGAMGDRSVMQFVAQCDPDYVAGRMLQGRQTRIAKHERDYTTRIAAEVIAEFRTLIDDRDAAPGVES